MFNYKCKMKFNCPMCNRELETEFETIDPPLVGPRDVINTNGATFLQNNNVQCQCGNKWNLTRPSSRWFVQVEK